jgi:hypothetical protein
MVSQDAIPSRKHLGGYKSLCLHRAVSCNALQCAESDQAIEVNIQIMRAFVKLREMLSSNKELAHKLTLLDGLCCP